MNGAIENQLNDLEKNLGYYCGRVLGYPLVSLEHVYFSLTNRCNLKCSMCSIATSPDNTADELSTPHIKEIIRAIKKLGIEHLIFSGGEPLLRKDLLDLVACAVSAKISMVDIITNGQLLNDGTIKELIALKLNHITISLDGMAKVNDAIRGKGVFKKAEENIDKLNYYKAQQGSRLPTTGINFTIMDRNVDDILPMVRFAKSKKINIIVFQPVLFNNIKMDDTHFNAHWPKQEKIPQLEGILKEIVRIKKDDDGLCVCTNENVIKAMPRFFEGKRAGVRFKCYEAIKRIVITCAGQVWSCKGVYGDLRKATLEEAWLSDEAHQVREKAKQCKKHCLQDCVFFPANLRDETRCFLRHVNAADNKTREQMRQRLSGTINSFLGMLPPRRPGGIVDAESANARHMLNALRRMAGRDSTGLEYNGNGKHDT